MEPLEIRISSIIPVSEANGPGPHYTIWFQGCNLKCPGCFNPNTHSRLKGNPRTISSILAEIKGEWELKRIRGVTITGGEPFQQADGLIQLVKGIKEIGEIGIIVLTGYDEIELAKIPEFDVIKNSIDLIIAGRYRENRKIQKGLRGSSNKEYIFLSGEYLLDDFVSIPALEITTNNNGIITLTGIMPDLIRNHLE